MKEILKRIINKEKKLRKHHEGKNEQKRRSAGLASHANLAPHWNSGYFRDYISRERKTIWLFGLVRMNSKAEMNFKLVMIVLACALLVFAAIAFVPDTIKTAKGLLDKIGFNFEKTKESSTIDIDEEQIDQWTRIRVYSLDYDKDSGWTIIRKEPYQRKWNLEYDIDSMVPIIEKSDQSTITLQAVPSLTSFVTSLESAYVTFRGAGLTIDYPSNLIYRAFLESGETTSEVDMLLVDKMKYYKEKPQWKDLTHIILNLKDTTLADILRSDELRGKIIIDGKIYVHTPTEPRDPSLQFQWFEDTKGDLHYTTDDKTITPENLAAIIISSCYKEQTAGSNFDSSGFRVCGSKDPQEISEVST